MPAVPPIPPPLRVSLDAVLVERLQCDVHWGVVLVMSLLFLLRKDFHRCCTPGDLDDSIDVPVLQSYFTSEDEANWESNKKFEASACPHRKQAGNCSAGDVDSR